MITQNNDKNTTILRGNLNKFLCFKIKTKILVFVTEYGVIVTNLWLNYKNGT